MRSKNVVFVSNHLNTNADCIGQQRILSNLFRCHYQSRCQFDCLTVIVSDGGLDLMNTNGNGINDIDPVDIIICCQRPEPKLIKLSLVKGQRESTGDHESFWSISVCSDHILVRNKICFGMIYN